MKALLVAAAAGLAMGVAAGAVVRLPPPVEPETSYDFQTAAFAEDPGVELHRLAMGSEPWEAPQPYIRVSYPPVAFAPEAPELADVALSDLWVETSPEIAEAAVLSSEAPAQPDTTSVAVQPIQVAAYHP